MMGVSGWRAEAAWGAGLGLKRLGWVSEFMFGMPPRSRTRAGAAAGGSVRPQGLPALSRPSGAARGSYAGAGPGRAGRARAGLARDCDPRTP